MKTPSPVASIRYSGQWRRRVAKPPGPAALAACWAPSDGGKAATPASA
jgi:hypothetical protein